MNEPFERVPLILRTGSEPAVRETYGVIAYRAGDYRTASRELRTSLEGVPAASDASFDAGSARCIAAHHNGKHSVNLDDLGNSKVHTGIAGPAVHGDASGVARN